MQLSFVIPTYRRISILSNTLQALENISDVEFEVIVVNDDKNVRAEDLKETISTISNLQIVDNPGQGCSSARNYGARIAKGRVLVFLDDDILVNEISFKNLLRLHNRYDKIAVNPLWIYSDIAYARLASTAFGRYRIRYVDSFNPSSTNKFNVKGELEHNLFEVHSLAAFCLSIEREYFYYLGGFDQDIKYDGEDWEFSERAKKQGFLLLLDKNQVAFHNELDRVERYSWMQRQYKGISGIHQLQEKLPQLLEMAVWRENCPVRREDPVALTLKKLIKSGLTQKTAFSFSNKLIDILDRIAVFDIIRFKLYSFQVALYMKKGFDDSNQA